MYHDDCECSEMSHMICVKFLQLVLYLEIFWFSLRLLAQCNTIDVFYNMQKIRALSSESLNLSLNCMKIIVLFLITEILVPCLVMAY